VNRTTAGAQISEAAAPMTMLLRVKRLLSSLSLMSAGIKPSSFKEAWRASAIFAV
jgi:hypothetical protein